MKERGGGGGGREKERQEEEEKEMLVVVLVGLVCVCVGVLCGNNGEMGWNTIGILEGPHKTLKETPARADLDRPTDPQRPYDAKPTIRQNLIFCEK